MISLNVAKFEVPAESPFNGSVTRHPMMPPSRQSNTDSNRNELRILKRLKPIARSVPISHARFATASYSQPRTWLRR